MQSLEQEQRPIVIIEERETDSDPRAVRIREIRKKIESGNGYAKEVYDVINLSADYYSSKPCFDNDLLATYYKELQAAGKYGAMTYCVHQMRNLHEAVMKDYLKDQSPERDKLRSSFISRANHWEWAMSWVQKGHNDPSKTS